MTFDLSDMQTLAAAGSAGQVEGGAQDALDALAGVDLLLNRDLVGRALLEVAADADVGALGVLAQDDEIDVLRRLVLERAEPRGRAVAPAAG